MRETSVTVPFREGLHARLAAELVTIASKFESHIAFAHDENSINGKSIMGILMLAAGHGMVLRLTADGVDEDQAIRAIESFFTPPQDDQSGEGDSIVL